MAIETTVKIFDQGIFFKGYAPDAFSGLEYDDREEFTTNLLKFSNQTTVLSETANAIIEEVFEVGWDFPQITPISKSKTLLSAPFATLLSGQSIASIEKAENPLSHVERQLAMAIETNPVEDGYSHVGEKILEKTIREFGTMAANWLIELLSSERWNASCRAELLRLLCRLKPFTEARRLQLIRTGLSATNLELRDAAVQAAETWEDTGAIGILRGHKESVAWLDDYIACVILDLERS